MNENSVEQNEVGPDIIAELGDLGSGAVIYEEGLARLFDRHRTSVKRAIERGELPPPTRLFNQNAWTAGVLVKHFERRQADAAEKSEQIQQKIRKLQP